MTASLIDIAKGSVVGHRTHTVVGRRADLSTSEADVWSAGESAGPATRTAPSAAGAMSVVSTSANDTAAGSGAQSVEIDYLDADHAEKTVSVSLNGTTPVPSDAAIRVQQVRTKAVGADGTNAGALTVSIGGNVQAHVPVGAGQSQQALWTVPAGYKALLLREWVESASPATGRLYTRAAGSSPRLLRREHRTTAPHGGGPTRALEAFDSKTDLIVRAVADAPGPAHVVAGVELLLVAV